MSPTSGVIGEAWNVYKTHWRHLLTIAFVVYLTVSLVGLVLGFVFDDWIAGSLGALIGLVAVFFLQAALVKAVDDIREGRVDLSVGETFAAARAHLVPVTVAGLLLAIAIGIGVVVLVILGVILGGAGVFLGVLALLAWIAWLLVVWSLVTPAIVLENRGVGDALTRSRELVSGYGWGVLGVIVLAVLLVFAVGIAVGIVLFPLSEQVQNFVSSIVSGTLTAPFFALVLTLLYFRLRDAKQPEAAAPPPPAAEPPPATPA